MLLKSFVTQNLLAEGDVSIGGMILFDEGAERNVTKIKFIVVNVRDMRFSTFFYYLFIYWLFPGMLVTFI